MYKTLTFKFLLQKSKTPKKKTIKNKNELLNKNQGTALQSLSEVSTKIKLTIQMYI